MRTNKLGRFVIGNARIQHAIDGNPDLAAGLSAVFGKCIVIEARTRWDCGGAVEYLAYCDDFEAVPEACVAPTYEVDITKVEDFIAGQRVVAFDAKFRRAA